ECCAPWGAIPHADLLRRLPTRGLGDRLPALDVARGGRRPVPVAVAGAAPQVQQHPPLPAEQHVGGRNDAEPHRPTLLSAPCSSRRSSSTATTPSARSRRWSNGRRRVSTSSGWPRPTASTPCRWWVTSGGA